jgi:hypothetical protein
MEPTNRFPHVRCALLFVLLLLPGAATSAAPVTGLGLMGDSVLDEYRFPQFLPPGGFRPWTRNVPEILSNLRDTNFGPYSFYSRGAPRHQGFACNWALDGSTSADLIADGQHTGLAQQVRELYSPDVIQGPDPGGAIQAKVVGVATNVQIVIQTILAAHPAVNVVIANMPDLRAAPALKAAIASTPGLEIFAAGVDQGIQAYNAQIAALAAGSDRIAMVDAYGISQPAVAGAPVQLGDLTLDTNIPGTGAEHYFVDVLHRVPPRPESWPTPSSKRATRSSTADSCRWATRRSPTTPARFRCPRRCTQA